jgi:nitronate monooxygenase
MTEAAAAARDLDRMQVWTGQSAALARAEPAGDVVRRLWRDASALIPSGTT